jgi:CHASE1-domain containing sensor protein
MTEDTHRLDIKVFKHLAWGHQLSLRATLSSFTSLSFIAHVRHSERAAFEAAHQADHRPQDLNFSIVEAGAHGFQASPNATEYSVLTYTEPLVYEQQSIGYNLWSLESRRHAINASRHTGLAFATPLVEIFGGQSAQDKTFIV